MITTKEKSHIFGKMLSDLVIEAKTKNPEFDIVELMNSNDELNIRHENRIKTYIESLK